MEANKKAFIVERTDIKPHIGTVRGGHPNILAYGFLKEKLVVKPGQEIHFLIALDEIRPGGGIAEHYHANESIFHHVYYVISGKIMATVGDIEKTVGSDTVIYCQSNVKHSIKNTGKSIAKVLRMSAQSEPDDPVTFILSKKISEDEKK